MAAAASTMKRTTPALPPTEPPPRPLATSPPVAPAAPGPDCPGWPSTPPSTPAAMALALSTFSAPGASNEIDDEVYGPPRLPRPGVGSNGSQPYPLNQTSTQACALWSFTRQL